MDKYRKHFLIIAGIILALAGVWRVFQWAVNEVKQPDDLVLGATTYYVSNSGSDAAAGTSSGTAWRTIAKVEAQTFTAGDTIAFECGGVWREKQFVPPNDGSAGNPITFTNYGDCETNNLPLMTGSYDYGSSTDLWTDEGGNIWSTASGSFTSAVGHLFTWDGSDYSVDAVTPLTYESTEGGLTAQGEFWYDSTNDLVKMYSTTNPATAYDQIEIPVNTTLNIIYSGGTRHYITIDGLALMFSAQHCSTIGSSSSNWIVQNSILAFCGSIPYAGNGLDWHSSANNMIFQNNEVYQPHDSCVSPQNFNPGDEIHDIIIRNNNLHDCSTGFELLTYTPQGGDHDNVIIRDVTFENNTVDCNGGSYALEFNQVGDNGIQSLVWGRGTTTAIRIIGNTIKNCHAASASTVNGNGIRMITNGDAVYSTYHTDITIEGNKIFNNQYNCMSFEGNSFGSQVNSTSALIINNFCYNNGAEEIEHRTDPWATRFYYNTIVDTTGDTSVLFDGDSDATIILYGNILQSNTQQLVSHGGTFDSDYNLWNATGSVATWFPSWEGTSRADLAAVIAGSDDEDNSLTGYPLFVDPTTTAALNFKISTSSPAFDAGLDSKHATSTDYYGNPKYNHAWDIGAHELQAAGGGGGGGSSGGVIIQSGVNIQSGVTIY